MRPFSRNSGVFCRIPVIFTEIGGRNKKRRSVIILASMVPYVVHYFFVQYSPNRNTMDGERFSC